MRDWFVNFLRACRHYAIRIPSYYAVLGIQGLGRQLAIPTLAKAETGWDNPVHLDRLRVAKAASRIATEFTALPQNYAPLVMAEVAYLVGISPKEIVDSYSRKD